MPAQSVPAGTPGPHWSPSCHRSHLRPHVPCGIPPWRCCWRSASAPRRKTPGAARRPMARGWRAARAVIAARRRPSASRKSSDSTPRKRSRCKRSSTSTARAWSSRTHACARSARRCDASTTPNCANCWATRNSSSSKRSAKNTARRTVDARLRAARAAKTARRRRAESSSALNRRERESPGAIPGFRAFRRWSCDYAAAACCCRGPSTSARLTMPINRSNSSLRIAKCGVKRSEFSPPWITPMPRSRSHSSVDPVP